MPWGVLELLPDECELVPNKATKPQAGAREGELEAEVPVAVRRSSSATSLCSGSSSLSKTSNASSRCSFKPLKRTAGIAKGRIRIAIMGGGRDGTPAM